METMQIKSNLPSRYQDGHLDLDFERGLVMLDSQRLELTRKEYELLSLLVGCAGEIVRRDVLLMRVWGYGDQIRTRTLDVHIRRLRVKLASFSEQYIETIFGIGYRFQPFRMTRRFQPGLPDSSALALSA